MTSIDDVGGTLCPACGQDFVVRRRLRKTREIIQICPECDVVWGADSKITLDTAAGNYRLFMAERRLPDLWTELEEAKPNHPDR